MSVTNSNPETSIRYGVTSANGTEEGQLLMDEIMTRGENLTYNASLEEAKREAGDKWDEEMQEEFNNRYEANEEEYEYTDQEGNKFLLTWLGGAPLIFCIKTNNTVYVKALCSPCIPGAGDLDSGLTDSEQGYMCYGIPKGGDK